MHSIASPFRSVSALFKLLDSPYKNAFKEVTGAAARAAVNLPMYSCRSFESQTFGYSRIKVSPIVHYDNHVGSRLKILLEVLEDALYLLHVGFLCSLRAS